MARAFGVPDVDEMHQEEYRRVAIECVAQLSKDVGIPQSLHGIARRRTSSS